MSKIIVGNVYSKLEDVDKSIIDFLDSEFAIKQPGYFFSPAFKKGYWDGRVRFFNKRNNTFPTGLLQNVLRATESDFEIVDNRKPLEIEIPTKIDLYEPEAEGGKITLRDYQYNAVKNALEKTRGIVNVATNGGKTEIASGIIKMILPHLKNGEKILFVTHSKEIATQSAKRIAKRLDIEVGMIGSGKWEEKQVTVVMIPTVSKYIKKPSKKDIKYTKEMQSILLLKDLLGGVIKKKDENRKTLINTLQILEEDTSKNRDQGAIDIVTEILSTETTDLGCYRAFKEVLKALSDFEEKRLSGAMSKYNKTMELLESAKCFIGDEFHHSSSSTWYDTLMLCKNATYRFGLTGTVDEDDEINYMRMLGVTGERVIKISNEFLISRGFSAKPTIFLEEVEEPKLPGVLSYQEAYEHAIVENEVRNKKIVERVKDRYEDGKGCLIIVNRKKHGETLKKMLDELSVECEFTHGSFSRREEVLDDMKEGRLKVLIATSILDEGVDVSGINCLWMAAGGKSFRQVLQRIGRGLRKKDDGSGLEVYDFLDYTQKHLIKHTQERYTYYKNEGFEIKKV